MSSRWKFDLKTGKFVNEDHETVLNLEPGESVTVHKPPGVTMHEHRTRFLNVKAYITRTRDRRFRVKTTAPNEITVTRLWTDADFVAIGL